MFQLHTANYPAKPHHASDDKGRHYSLIKDRLDPGFTQTSLSRVHALAKVQPRREDWYEDAGQSLATSNIEAWNSQNSVDQRFDSLQDVYTFAQPLLQAALKRHYRLDLDVQATWLKLYLPKERPWYVIDTSDGVITRTVSLLDAALHNFARSETYAAGSAFITRPDERGHFDVLPIERYMSIRQFQALCRDLDIGARYQRHLKQTLLPTSPVAVSVMQYLVGLSQRSALKTAAHLAWAKRDISRNGHSLVMSLLHGQTGLTLDGNVMQACDLCMMDTTLTGIVIFTPVEQQAQNVGRVLAYVPHDPHHPLMEYPSATDCMNEITRQLRENAVLNASGQTYQQFFSQFVDQQQRGHLFAGLGQRLSRVKWHEKQPFDMRPTWRDTPVDKPNLQFCALPITRPLWEHLYQQKLNKILNDARDIAVSTADTDAQARWAWWDNFKKIVGDIFNVALMVLTPFVPGLGELMLVYTVYQLTNDVIEGVVDLAEQQWTEAAEHLVGVTTDIIQLATFAAGGAIGNAFRLKLSPLVEGMTPVRLPSGEVRLWNPDLTPYQQKNLPLPATSTPDALGLHQVDGQTVLPLDDGIFVLEKAEGSREHRVQHPNRPQAYEPKLTHNGHGAWLLEGENPRDWDAATLMRRLGHRTDGLSDAQLEQIRLISGTDEGSLRWMHVEQTAPPLLLDDTLKRFRAFRDIDVARERIRSGAALDPASYWFEQLVTELPGWPADYALKVYERADLSGMSRTYGDAGAPGNRTLAISLGDVMAGKLPERVVDLLNETQLTQLLGEQRPVHERVQALRERLAEQVEGRKSHLADYLYRAREPVAEADVQRLQQRYPDLPGDIAQILLADANARERRVLSEQQHIPLRLNGMARECAFETRAARASEGFYQNARMSADTERLALNVLRLNSDTFNQWRIEVREGTFDGPLRCAVGSDDASTVRLMVRDERGRYEVRDTANRRLHRAYNLYEAILRAMPEAAREEIGYLYGQGRWFKDWLLAKSEAPEQRRTALLEPSIRPRAQPETLQLLQGPSLGKELRTVEQRAQDLYPHLSEREITRFLASFPADVDRVQQLNALKSQLDTLRNRLSIWREESSTALPDEPSIQPDAVRHIADRLLECFERRARVFDELSLDIERGYALDLSSDLRRYNLEHWWRKLPDLTTYLDQITTLNLDGMTFSQGPGGLLQDFTQLRQFSARHCELIQLPSGVARMTQLETLRLSDNRIRLIPETVARLQDLTRLQTLRLEHNPLGLPPNVQRMPRLKILNLANTGLDTWPEGLLNKHRPRGFFLDLLGNPIRTIPRAVRGSNEARIIARTRLDSSRLLDAHRLALYEYRRSVGLPRENAYEPLAAHLREKWPLSDDSLMWGNHSPGLGAYRAEAWDNLLSEPNSSGFFRIIDSLTTSADYQAGGRSREQLSRRVWELIDAMDLDTPLREKLFSTAEDPTSCADASTEVFNTMGVQALASQAYAYSTSAAELETRLVTLGRGAARLDSVNQIARADALSRPSRAEEVEIYLAYQTNLAQRLGLPWQSDSLLYRDIAGVTDAAIDQAYATVLAREAGDGLVNGMLEQPFWDQYLRERYPDRFSANDRFYNQQQDRLEDEYTAADGDPMAEREYSRRTVDLAYQRSQLGRELTRVLLQNQGLLQADR